MLSRSLFGCLILLLAVAATCAADKKKKKNAAKATADRPAVDSDKLRPGVFTGKLVSPPGTDGEFSVEVMYNVIEPKAQAKLSAGQVKIQRQVMAVQKKAARGKVTAADMNRLQRLQAQVQRNAAGQVKTASQRVDFHAARDVKVRLMEPPQQFTEKGDIKKFTTAELEKMKGKERNLPGFEGSLADLRAGQIVRVSQTAAAGATAPKDDLSIENSNHRSRVTLIVVLGTPAEPTAKTPRKSK